MASSDIISYQIDTSKAQKSLDALKGSLTAVKQEQNKLHTAFHNGEVDADTYAAKMERLKKAQSDIQQQISTTTKTMSKQGTTLSSVTQTASALGTTGGKAIGSLTSAAGGLNTAFKALIANPIVAVVAAIVAVLMKAVDAIRKNEELMNRLNKVFAVFKPIGNLVAGIFDKLAEGLVWCAEKAVSFIQPLEKIGVKLAELVTKFTPFGRILKAVGVDLGEAAKSAVESANAMSKATVAIEEAQQRLTAARRDAAAQAVWSEDRIAEMQDRLAEKESLSYEERIRLVKKMNEERAAQLRTSLTLAQEELRIMEAENALAPNSAEDNEKLAQAKLKVAKAQKELNAANRRGQLQLRAEEKSIESERQALAKSAAEREAARKKQEEEEAKAEQQRLKTVEDTNRKVEDLRAKAIKDDLARARREAEISYNRTMAELDNQILANRQDAEMTRALCDLKEETQKAYYAAIDQMDEEHRQRIREKEEQDAAETAAQRDAIIQRQLSNKELEIQMIDDKDARELASLELRMERLDYEYEQQQQKYRENEEQMALIDEEFALRRQQLEQQTANARQQQDAARKKQTAELIKQGIEQSATNMANMDKESKATKALMKVKQAMMVAEAAKGLATGISEAASAGWPMMLASIPTVFAMMIALITQIKGMSGAGYATGGYVTGPGTGTSDSINARLSNGEYVINAKATAANRELLDAVNNAGGQRVAVQQQSSAALAAELAFAVQQMPAPVVSVEDITEATNRTRYVSTRDI